MNDFRTNVVNLPYKCPKCEFRNFPSLHQLRAHLESEHQLMDKRRQRTNVLDFDMERHKTLKPSSGPSVQHFLDENKRLEKELEDLKKAEKLNRVLRRRNLQHQLDNSDTRSVGSHVSRNFHLMDDSDPNIVHGLNVGDAHFSRTPNDQIIAEAVNNLSHEVEQSRDRQWKTADALYQSKDVLEDIEQATELRNKDQSQILNVLDKTLKHKSSELEKAYKDIGQLREERKVLLEQMENMLNQKKFADNIEESRPSSQRTHSESSTTAIGSSTALPKSPTLPKIIPQNSADTRSEKLITERGSVSEEPVRLSESVIPSQSPKTTEVTNQVMSGHISPNSQPLVTTQIISEANHVAPLSTHTNISSQSVPHLARFNSATSNPQNLPINQHVNSEPHPTKISDGGQYQKPMLLIPRDSLRINPTQPTYGQQIPQNMNMPFQQALPHPSDLMNSQSAVSDRPSDPRTYSSNPQVLPSNYPAQYALSESRYQPIHQSYLPPQQNENIIHPYTRQEGFNDPHNMQNYLRHNSIRYTNSPPVSQNLHEIQLSSQHNPQTSFDPSNVPNGQASHSQREPSLDPTSHPQNYIPYLRSTEPHYPLHKLDPPNHQVDQKYAERYFDIPSLTPNPSTHRHISQDDQTFLPARGRQRGRDVTLDTVVPETPELQTVPQKLSTRNNEKQEQVSDSYKLKIASQEEEIKIMTSHLTKLKNKAGQQIKIKDSQLATALRRSEKLEEDRQILLLEMEDLLSKAGLDNEKLRSELQIKEKELKHLNNKLEQTKSSQTQLVSETFDLYRDAEINMETLKEKLRLKEQELMLSKSKIESIQLAHEKVLEENKRVALEAQKSGETLKTLLDGKSQEINVVHNELKTVKTKEEMLAQEKADLELKIQESERTQKKLFGEMKNKTEELTNTQRELDEVKNFLKTTAAKEKIARGELEEFIEKLLSRAEKAENQIESLKSKLAEEEQLRKSLQEAEDEASRSLEELVSAKINRREDKKRSTNKKKKSSKDENNKQKPKPRHHRRDSSYSDDTEDVTRPSRDTSPSPSRQRRSPSTHQRRSPSPSHHRRSPKDATNTREQRQDKSPSRKHSDVSFKDSPKPNKMYFKPVPLASTEDLDETDSSPTSTPNSPKRSIKSRLTVQNNIQHLQSTRSYHPLQSASFPNTPVHHHKIQHIETSSLPNTPLHYPHPPDTASLPSTPKNIPHPPQQPFHPVPHYPHNFPFLNSSASQGTNYQHVPEQHPLSSPQQQFPEPIPYSQSPLQRQPGTYNTPQGTHVTGNGEPIPNTYISLNTGNPQEHSNQALISPVQSKLLSSKNPLELSKPQKELNDTIQTLEDLTLRGIITPEEQTAILSSRLHKALIQQQLLSGTKPQDDYHLNLLEYGPVSYDDDVDSVDESVKQKAIHNKSKMPADKKKKVLWSAEPSLDLEDLGILDDVESPTEYENGEDRQLQHEILKLSPSYSSNNKLNNHLSVDDDGIMWDDAATTTYASEELDSFRFSPSGSETAGDVDSHQLLSSSSGSNKITKDQSRQDTVGQSPAPKPCQSVKSFQEVRDKISKRNAERDDLNAAVGILKGHYPLSSDSDSSHSLSSPKINSKYSRQKLSPLDESQEQTGNALKQEEPLTSSEKSSSSFPVHKSKYLNSLKSKPSANNAKSRFLADKSQGISPALSRLKSPESSRSNSPYSRTQSPSLSPIPDENDKFIGSNLAKKYSDSNQLQTPESTSRIFSQENSPFPPNTKPVSRYEQFYRDKPETEISTAPSSLNLRSQSVNPSPPNIIIQSPVSDSHNKNSPTYPGLHKTIGCNNDTDNAMKPLRKSDDLVDSGRTQQDPETFKIEPVYSSKQTSEPNRLDMAVPDSENLQQNHEGDPTSEISQPNLVTSPDLIKYQEAPLTSAKTYLSDLNEYDQSSDEDAFKDISNKSIPTKEESTDFDFESDLEKLATPHKLGRSSGIKGVKGSSKKTGPLLQKKLKTRRQHADKKAHIKDYDSSSAFSDSGIRSGHKKYEAKRRRVALFRVFNYLDVKTLCSVSLVCKEWKAVSRHPALWTNIQLKNEIISSSFLITLSQWCTQTEHLKLEGLRTRRRFDDESLEEYHRHIRGCLETGLEELLKTCQDSLKSLRIINCSNILTDKCIWLVSGYCRLLQKFYYISDTDPISAETLWALGGGCPGLTTLIIPPAFPTNKPKALTNKCLTLIAKFYPDMLELGIGGKEIDQDGLVPLISGCQRLTYLQFDHTTSMTEDTAKALCHAGLRQLNILELINMPVDHKAVSQFYNSCHHLKRIQIDIQFSDYYDDSKNKKHRNDYKKKIQQLQDLKKKAGIGHILKIYAEQVD